MEIGFRPPQRPLAWPALIERLAAISPDPARLYLVGGPVRDALRQRPIHDFDFVTLDDGLGVARRMADQLKGAYYPIDPERRTGRIILSEENGQTVIDVASLRGSDLLEDLRARDFTVNAMAVRLDRLEEIVDPLGGQRDLFDEKALRQCNSRSIASDPIRALRAARLSMQLSLRMEASTRDAARDAGPDLVDVSGMLKQPERARDELFKLLALSRPASALRLLDSLNLLVRLAPTPLPADSELERRLATIDALSSLIAIIGATRDDNSAADLILGMAVMVLDRYRKQLQEHLARPFADGRLRMGLMILGITTSLHEGHWHSWGPQLRLSNAETDAMVRMEKAARFGLLDISVLDDRVIHRYFRGVSEAGVDGVLLTLADYLSSQRPTPDSKAWGRLLETIAAPLLEAFFQRRQHVVAPPLLLTGNDLQGVLGLEPGPRIGQLLEQLREEQAAGEVRSKNEAIDFVRRLITGDVTLHQQE